MPQGKGVYLCPVCKYHRQKFGATTRDKLENHLLWSHPQIDLAKYVVGGIQKNVQV